MNRYSNPINQQQASTCLNHDNPRFRKLHRDVYSKYTQPRTSVRNIADNAMHVYTERSELKSESSTGDQ